ncbi:MAG: hypothetical protein ACTSWN_02820 [Promethearchaeota archaeon]
MNFAHGKWCRTRSFPFICKSCGARLLYWECSHGSKVVFEFDSRGRLKGKHKCKKTITNKNKAKKKQYFDYDSNFDLSTISKTFLEKLFEKSYQCPVCMKKFKEEKQYYNHLKSKKEYDNKHAAFFEENYDVLKLIMSGKDDATIHPPIIMKSMDAIPIEEGESREPLNEQDPLRHFGRIRLKSSKGKVRLVRNANDWWDEFKNSRSDG